MATVDVDAVIQQTVQQLGAENALLRLELNAARAAHAAAAAELEQLKTDKEEPADE